ncbi:DUF4062 domain-containing protein [Candidatus Rhodobacter oscarellae]|uniref:DUF4062 domain-containing protein n=1 Tax=Candidatus Rhodobacter oscarellae TaxID=1675527 RepID=UPI00069E5880|nr:DUF4062 domain-containing protein [Candidatus Rhodobacter lobularis]
MEKRYQVFISSEFQDLQNARQEVSQALLRADCFPAGMELFPAADEEQFEFIKTVIDQSDYYIIISAGRYGSIHPETGLSYTEMEYDYAVETGKPVIRLLHKDPESLPSREQETSNHGKVKLDSFRRKMSEATLVKFWENPSQLGAEVAFSLMDIQRRHPSSGWVRGANQTDKEESPNTRVPIGSEVFISVSSKDLDWGDWIAWKLRDLGYHVRYHRWELGIGTDVAAWMADAVASSQVAVLLFSKHTEAASEISLEQRFIANVGLDQKAIKVLPILVDPVKIPRIFANLYRVELFSKNQDEAAKSLLKVFSGFSGGYSKEPLFPGGNS